MTIPGWMWIATIAALLALLAFDFWLVSRNPRDPSLRESTAWVTFYVSLAVLFGFGVMALGGSRYGGEFFAGWITEYSLSIDNLFIFVLIMTRFSVPRQYRQKVLLIGIVLALVMRGVFIALGAGMVARFNWIFYIFGAFLLYTAWKLIKDKGEDEEFSENAALRTVRRVLPTTSEYHGAAMTTRVNGRRMVTPMLIVMVAIGTTDLLFAVDSIPAIFGLTKEPYLVFTANAFALMGLRQLFFLIGGLLDRLIYLSKGLAIILAFIGVKLILEALHHQGLHWVPEIPILVSLLVIIGTLAVTAVLSLAKSHKQAAAERESSAAEDAPVAETPAAETPAAETPAGETAGGEAEVR
ncbi:TerC family protein [Haloactinomyces albus]|uniref:Tellurite resistance protein TerC n=1 Tax=Haloactinomyces albus TaxID=1352928 RepID=A0AAE3ZJN3_9ACTN|nr:TerC family protein [Haloactinomyces albus]MDR7304387.1 tellurite resistance protein TerC [Haloactinomyces albus]